MYDPATCVLLQRLPKSLNTRKLLDETIRQINLPEPADEIREVALLLIENVSGLSRPEILAGKEIAVADWQQKKLRDDVVRINQHEPVQYITGRAWFYGREFRVTPDVLIPRPETEELIDAVRNIFPAHAPLQILDVGTGSGCIAITLKLEFPHSKVYAIDISPAALNIARLNAEHLNAPVEFMWCDFLKSSPDVSHIDVLISNPPYIAECEKELLKPNVVNFEPHQALFVADDDPLIFYKALAKKGKELLKKSGYILAEINERLGKESHDVFAAYGYTARVVKDLSGKDRIVVANLM